MKAKYLLFSLMLFSLLSCRKEVVSERPSNLVYLNTYPESESIEFTYVEPASDGGFMIAGYDHPNTQNINRLYLFNFNRFGQLESKTSFEASAQTVPFMTKLSNGRYFMNGQYSSDIALFSESGQLIWKDTVLPNFSSNYIYSKAVEDSEGNIFFSLSNGHGQWGTIAYALRLDKDGILRGYYQFFDSDVAGKILQLSTLRVDEEKYWFIGTQFDSSNISWSAPVHVFILSLGDSGLVDKYRLPRSNVQAKNYLVDFEVTSDRACVGVLCPSWIGTGDYQMDNATSSFEVFKVSEDLDLEWERTLYFNGVHKISPADLLILENGEFLITGYCRKPNNPNQLPFMMRLDKNGNVIVQKIYEFNGKSILVGTAEIENGNYVMVGSSSGFGEDQNRFEGLLMVTDPFGNY